MSGSAEGFTAFAAISDLHALRALTELQRAGISVPEQVSVTGFDDLVWSSVVTPTLTTVRMDMERIAEIAIAALVEAIEVEKTDGRGASPAGHSATVKAAVRSVPMELIVRQSSGRAPNIQQKPQARSAGTMKTVLFASGVALILGAFPAAAQERTLTISVYAFAQDDYKKIVYDPFEAKCGCKLVVETGNSGERIAKMEANKANPVVDLAAVSMADALSASRAGLIDKVDTSKLTNFDKIYDVAKDPNGDGMSVGYTFYATSIVYRSDKVKINSWADLLKDDVASHLAFPNVTTNQGPPALYMLGLALGKDTPDLKAPIDALGAAEGQDRHLLRQVVAAHSAHAAGGDLGCADRPLRLGRLRQDELADHVGDPEGRPDRRHERAGADQGQQEPGPRHAAHGFLAVDRRPDQARREADRQPGEHGSEGVAGGGRTTSPMARTPPRA